MIFYLKSNGSNEVKNIIDASNKIVAEKYFASLLNLDRKILLKLFFVQKKK